MENDITNLAFEGGGVLGYAYIGAIQELFRQNKLKNVKNYSGSSIGSVFAALLACGADEDFIEDINFDSSNIKDVPCLPCAAIWGVFKKFGYYKGDSLYKQYEQYIKKLTGKREYTFGQLFKDRGVSLIITGSNLSRGKVIFFSHKEYPDMPISLAMRISSSYPLVFRAMRFCGDVYVDGGLYLNYPIDVFEDDTKTLGLKLISKGEIEHEYAEISNFKGFIKTVLVEMHNHIQQLHIKKGDWERTIKIDVDEIKSIDFNISTADKNWLISQGFSAVKQYFGVNDEFTLEITF